MGILGVAAGDDFLCLCHKVYIQVVPETERFSQNFVPAELFTASLLATSRQRGKGGSQVKSNQ